LDKKSIIVVGAGIAGLSAGCYAQMNGFESRIFEMHSLPGGLCTSWKRGDYLFDGCLDWLTGTAPDGMFYPLWQELGVLQNNEFLYDDAYCRYVTDSSREVVFYLDVRRLEKELLRHAPDDATAISELCNLHQIAQFADCRRIIRRLT
jgi:phytoene dehydrogenase-like protein